MLEKLLLATAVTISLHLLLNFGLNPQKDHFFGQNLNPSVASFSFLMSQK
jgi:tryptophanyl-tRNA synthetase